MIAGREVLGFPKKLGDFAFEVDGRRRLRRGVRRRRRVPPGRANHRESDAWRRGIGRNVRYCVGYAFVGQQHDIPGSRNVFLNAATSHPLPPENPRRPDGACLGNRPRLLQFVFDEIAMDGATWRISDADVSLRETKTDAILRPFPKDAEDEDEDVRRLEVLDASAGVTNLYTGEEGMPTLGETIPGGYVENDEVYWLRYQ